MSRLEKVFPFIFAVVVPAVGMLSSAVDEASLLKSFMLWEVYLRSVITILILWYINSWVLHTDIRVKRLLGSLIFTILVNAAMISLLGLIENKFPLRGNVITLPVSLQIIRVCMGLFIINTTLRIFQTQREKSALKVQNLSLQAENLKFQIETLKQQINPHFLFNSLNTLLDLIEEDPQKAARYTRSFSKLFRVVLQSVKHDLIPLRDELEFLADYWSLLKVRFNDAIDLDINISEEKKHLMIPPLCLQFLIENAVKHNEATKQAPLKISIFDVDDKVYVKNNLRPKPFPASGEKVGLANLQKRFTLLLEPIGYGFVEDTYQVVLPLQQRKA